MPCWPAPASVTRNSPPARVPFDGVRHDSHRFSPAQAVSPADLPSNGTQGANIEQRAGYYAYSDGMAALRDRALDAGVELIGTQGMRALTHVRVDEQAGLPRGSTSNYFRTRAALVEAVVGWVADHEMGDFDPGFDPALASVDDVIDALCALFALQIGPARARTLARYVLFLESAHDPELRAPLVVNRRRFEQWTTTLLSALGAPDPKTAARALMAGGEGLILHALTVDAEADLRPAVALLVHACLTPAPRNTPPRTVRRS